jgi:hypothetical protein
MAPEKSLPQLEQVRWGSVLMDLPAPSVASSTERKTGLHREVRNRPARPLANCCPIPQAIECCFIVAREITFRNNIPVARVLRRHRDAGEKTSVIDMLMRNSHREAESESEKQF